MFAPSFFTGHIIKRFGVLNVITVGIILMFGSAAIGFSGIAVTQFWWALFLWRRLELHVHRRDNLGRRKLPGGRACKSSGVSRFHGLHLRCHRYFSSGSIQHLWGLDWINTAMVIPMAVVLLATAWLRLYNRRAATAG